MPYTPQFKENVVKKALAGEKTQTQISKEMGVPLSTMQHWLKKTKISSKDSMSQKPHVSGKMTPVLV